MDGVQRISSSDLTTTIPHEGWPEIKSLISVFNRMMLELQAYRGFQLSKIVEEKTKAEALIDTIPDGVVLVDQNNRLMSSNQIALKLLGIPKASPDVVLPKSVRNIDFFKEISNLISSKEKFVTAELVSTISQNPPITKNFRILSNQYMLATLKKPGRILIIRDITTEKELEKAKEDFFHMITHDMRAPLASIQGYVELLKKMIPPSDKTEKFISNMLFSSRRLRGMIDDILNITKLEKGTMMLQLDTISAEGILTGIRDNFEPISGPKNIKIIVAPPKQAINFNADPILIERVISNLIGNALKFTPSGGTITLSGDENEQEIFLWVQDTGPGVPEDKRKIIFEKYSQLEKHKQMGFGLGLAMCRMAVELHQGKIWVESEVGKGSTFIFTVSKSLVVSQLAP
jgi:signal transduction histidine kinase